tara:strand:- start:978 stop:1199 length:222 start_codon:yes stop_codon:yes gene_type:complete
MNTGAKIRRAREAKGLSRFELCRKVGISPSWLRNIEVNNSSINLMDAALIAKFLDVRIEELVGDSIEELVGEE